MMAHHSNKNVHSHTQHVYLAADIKKIVSDEIYGPMFFQVRHTA